MTLLLLGGLLLLAPGICAIVFMSGIRSTSPTPVPESIKRCFGSSAFMISTAGSGADLSTPSADSARIGSAQVTRNPILTILMALVGIILLLPGVCAVAIHRSPPDRRRVAMRLPALGLWAICFLISAGGGVPLCSRAFRKQAPHERSSTAGWPGPAPAPRSAERLRAGSARPARVHPAAARTVLRYPLALGLRGDSDRTRCHGHRAPAASCLRSCSSWAFG